MYWGRKLAIWPAIAVACAGCATGITITHVDSNSPLKGNPWNLPMTQFKITLTRHVTGCGSTLKGSVETIATSSSVLDPDQRYVLFSNGWLSTSDITSNLAPTGISTGLNAQSTDATATVISNIIGTVAQVAVLAAAGAAPPPPPGAPPPPPVELCKPDVLQAVNEMYPAAGMPLKAQVDKDTAALATATARVSLLTAQAALDSSLKPTLVAALGNQSTLQTQLAADQTKLTKDLGTTTDVQIVTWPLKASVFRDDGGEFLSDTVLLKWAKPEADTASAKSQFAVYFALYSQDAGTGKWSSPAKTDVADVKIGIPVRLARTGRLLVCAKTVCPPTLQAGFVPADAQTASDVVVLQMGQMYMIPAAGGTFRSESALISLDANGLPTSIEVAEKAAAAVGLSGAAKDAATQAAAIPASVRAAQLAKTQAEVNQLNANASLATAQASAGLQGQTNVLATQTAYINAQNALATAKQNAGVQVQTAAVTARSSLLQAQAALVNAQASSQDVGQTSVLAAQTTLTNAQTAQINAAAALAKAQATTP
jgi:hypothetical protein